MPKHWVSFELYVCDFCGWEEVNAHFNQEEPWELDDGYGTYYCPNCKPERDEEGI